LSCTIARQTGEDEKLFGAVTAKDISEALKEQEVEIDKKDILLTESIKELGVYSVAVRLHPQVTAKIKVWVVKKESEQNGRIA